MLPMPLRAAALSIVALAAVACSSGPAAPAQPAPGPAVVESGCGPSYPAYDDSEATNLGRPYVRVLRRECVPLPLPELVSAGVAACQDLYGGGSPASARAAVLRGYPEVTERHAAAIVGAAQGVMCGDTR